MADKNTKLSIIVEAENRATAGLSGVKDSLEKMDISATRIGTTLQTMGKYGAIGFTAITTALGFAVGEAKTAEAAQFRLAQILKTATGATDAQIAALNAQADALERVGVVSGEGATQVQAQLATFDLQADTISALTPAILDYAVAEKGAAVSTDELQQMTNGLAQALNGNFASLTKVGFVLDENTRELISNGTEAERVAAIVDVLNSTYEGFNEAARATSEGSLVALNNEFGKLKETIGVLFLPVLTELVQKMQPVIENVSTWIRENPELTRNIIFAAGAVAGLVALVGMLSVVMLAFNPVAAGIVLAITGIILIVKGAMNAIGMLKEHWGSVWQGIKDITTAIIDSIIGMVEAMINKVISGINILIKNINKVIQKASELTGLKVSTIKSLDTVDFGRVGEKEMVSRAPSEAFKAPVYLSISGNMLLSEDAAEEMGDKIVSRLKLSSAL